MGIPHKHASIIKAWADGAEIQGKGDCFEDWTNLKSPAWSLDWEYRVKPKPPVKKYQYAYKVKHQVPRITVFSFEDDLDFLGNCSPSNYEWFTKIKESVQEYPAK